MDDSELQEELEKCQKESDLLRDQYARVLADLENYRRRVSRDQASWSRVAQEQVLIQLLNVMDDFERALEQGANEVSDEVRVWLSGFELTQASLLKLLQKFGVTEMTQSEHHVTFNPEYHEAIAQVDSGEYKSGSIVKVLQKGYLKDGIVMRPARVSVAK